MGSPRLGSIFCVFWAEHRGEYSNSCSNSGHGDWWGGGGNGKVKTIAGGQPLVTLMPKDSTGGQLGVSSHSTHIY